MQLFDQKQPLEQFVRTMWSPVRPYLLPLSRQVVHDPTDAIPLLDLGYTFSYGDLYGPGGHIALVSYAAAAAADRSEFPGHFAPSRVRKLQLRLFLRRGIPEW
jgi:hypothetical protein